MGSFVENTTRKYYHLPGHCAADRKPAGSTGRRFSRGRQPHSVPHSVSPRHPERRRAGGIPLECNAQERDYWLGNGEDKLEGTNYEVRIGVLFLVPRNSYLVPS